MKQAIRPLRAPQRPICRICDHILQQPAYRRAFITATTPKTPSIRTSHPPANGAFAALPRRNLFSKGSFAATEPEIERPTLNDSIPIDKQLAQIERQIDAIYNSPKVEDEAATLQILDGLDHIARRAISLRAGPQGRKVKLNLRQSSAGAVLSFADEAPAPQRAASKASKKDLPSPAYLSGLAEALLKHEKVFLSHSILKRYVDLQCLLQRPRAIPEIFQLYANKPIPQLGSSPPTYRKVKNWGPKQAIPAAIAEKALDAAIAAKDMPGALAVIDTTYCAPAFRTHKLLTKVFPPAMVAALTPFALYKVAEEISLYHGYLDPDKFKAYAFMGLMTYFTCTGTLGYVAFTTANDHHERVVWQPGTRLTERWVREEERAALDKIASAWGFKEVWKRGDEDGEEWQGLRQWCFLRGLWLDKPDLLPGMNPPMSSEI